MNEHRFEKFSLIRGAEMKRVGVQGDGRLIAWRNDGEGNPIALTVTWRGVSENPGSRYSGLSSYYPSETDVYEFVRTDDYDRRVYRCVISWRTREEKRRKKNDTRK